MIKRIIILSIIYATLIIAITFSIDAAKKPSLFLIPVISLIFGVLLFREVYKGYLVNFKPQKNEISYTSTGNTELQALKKISTRPFFFGIEKRLINDNEFYFDDEHFYAVSKDLQKAVFKLADITELGKTAVQINNRRIWQVKIKQENEQMIIFKFAHNYTLWNKSFPEFYEKIKLLNPEAIKSKWSLWTM